MSIKSASELQKLKRIGEIVARTLQLVRASVEPGITTAELDVIAARYLAENEARSAPPFVYGFPGTLCISINDEAIHGIPGRRVVKAGDVVKLDLVAEKDGYFADAAITVNVPPVQEVGTQLARCAESAFRKALKVAKAGERVYEIGREVERETRSAGFRVIRELCGHGVGRSIHEEPSVPNYADKRIRHRLTEGLVLTIEPILSAGTGHAELEDDGWTIRTTDGALSAHFEHTIVITRGEPLILTQV
jgi:methionyl aminopeptidase